MNLDLALLRGFYLFTALIALAFFLQRYRWRRRRRLGKSNWGFYPSSAGMGNALQQLSTLAQPQVEHVLEEKLAEKADEDDEGGPLDPVQHLGRQCGRIRRGEKLGGMKVRGKL